MSRPAPILLTFDVEDWFQVENLRARVPRERWPAMDMRVQAPTLAILDLLDRAAHVRGAALSATFFVLGEIARRDPGLVREIQRRGHEVASHGMGHRLCGELSDARLFSDLTDSKKLLEDICGEAVSGFRAPSFTVSPRVIYAAREAGYLYDASYNSFSAHGRYGNLDTEALARHGLALEAAPGFFELPVSNLRTGRLVLPWGGGAYFRLLPLFLYAWGMKHGLNKQGAFMFYAHPWEADPGQPRLSGLSPFARFKHYTGLAGFLPKLAELVSLFSTENFQTCRRYLAATVPSHARSHP